MLNTLLILSSGQLLLDFVKVSVCRLIEIEFQLALLWVVYLNDCFVVDKENKEEKENDGRERERPRRTIRTMKPIK